MFGMCLLLLHRSKFGNSLSEQHLLMIIIGKSPQKSSFTYIVIPASDNNERGGQNARTEGHTADTVIRRRCYFNVFHGVHITSCCCTAEYGIGRAKAGCAAK